MGLVSALLLVPALSALTLALLPLSPKASKLVGSTASLVVLAIASCILWHFQPGTADFQFIEKTPWIAELGISYEVGIDGISLFLVLLTAIAGVAVVFSAKEQERLRGYLSLFLFLQLALLGVFVTLDLILFYVFFELMLVPSYLLMNGWGGPGRSRASIRFVLFTALGSVLMLSSIIFLGWLNVDQVGDPSFSIIDLSQSLRLEPGIEGLLFLGFFIAFAIKTPIVPFHNWLPAAYGEAPYGLTAFMSAVMAKAGLYGFLRFVWTLFPGALTDGISTLISSIVEGAGPKSFLHKLWQHGAGDPVDFTHWLIWLLVIGVVYTALIAWAQRDAKRLLAYSSVSHLGICAVGIFVCSTVSITAAVFFMLAHGVVSLGLFLTMGALASRTGSSEIIELGGIAEKLPKLSVLFFIFLLGAVALPLTGNFIAEFTVLIAVFAKFPLQTAVAAISIILGAVYMLALFRRSIFAKSDKSLSGGDLSNAELAILCPLAVLVILLGLMPQPFLRRIEPAAQRLEGFVFDAINSQSEQPAPEGGDFSASWPDKKSQSSDSAGNNPSMVTASTENTISVMLPLALQNIKVSKESI